MRKTGGIEGEELLRSWHMAKLVGLKQVEHAAQLEIPYTTYVNRMVAARSKRAEVVIPQSRYRVWNDPPHIEGDVLILPDMHIPYHNAEFIEKCIRAAVSMGISTVLFPGDVLEAAAFSAWPEPFSEERPKVISSELESKIMAIADKASPSIRAEIMDELAQAHREQGDISEEWIEARKVIRTIDQCFDRVVFCVGNHEDRIIRLLDKSITVEGLGAIMGATDKWAMTPFYYMTLTSGGIEWRISHPKNSAKGSAKRLAPKYQSNIVQLHGHHFAIQTDPSGKYLAVEPGACVDIDRLPYEKLRDTPGDMHVLGALIIKDGKPILLNEWTSWQLLTPVL